MDLLLSVGSDTVRPFAKGTGRMGRSCRPYAWGNLGAAAIEFCA